MNVWLGAVIAIVAGFIIGSVAGRFVRRVLGSMDRSDAIRGVAPAASSFVFAAGVCAGLIVAVGLVSPEQLETIPTSLVNYLPKAMIAGVMLMVGNVAASLAGVAVRSAAVRATGNEPSGAIRAVRIAILSTAGILAVGQLGIESTVINIAVAILLGTIGATFVLIVGIGGQEVARNVAAGRYARRTVHPGQQIEVAGSAGEVIAVHAATVEIRTIDGAISHLPNRLLLETGLRIIDSSSKAAAGTE